MESPTTHEESTVAVADTMVIPARSSMLIMVQVSRTFGWEGFVQPLCTTRTGIPKSILIARTLGCVDKNHSMVLEITRTGIPKSILVARTLGCVDKNHSMVLEIANISPTTTKIHKGTKLGTFVPMDEFWVVNSVQNDQRHGGEVATKLPAVDLTGTDLSSTQQQKLLELLATFSTLFLTPEEPLGKTSVVRHGIQTTGPPIRQRLHRIPESLKPVVEHEVHKMLQQGVVRPSTIPWSSPVVMVRKKDGGLRFCVDYRKVNSVTRQDAYPLPRIDATLDSLAGSVFFTTLDLASGYWQVEPDDEAKEKSAFSTQSGHFEFNVMPFGLTNAPATFQRLMECVLAELVPSECLIYLDDIIVFSTSFADHLTHLESVPMPPASWPEAETQQISLC